jgi:hypothetical protein
VKIEAACPAEMLYLRTCPRGVTTHKTNIDIFTAESDLKFLFVATEETELHSLAFTKKADSELYSNGYTSVHPVLLPRAFAAKGRKDASISFDLSISIRTRK